MGNRTKRKPGRQKPESSRPSIFFIIALVIGVILLMWMFSKATPRAASTTTSTTSTSTTSTSTTTSTTTSKGARP